jgi:O-antigen ligase
MTRAATALATLVAGGGTLLVLLVYVPALQAPFLVPKFAALELAASLGFTSFLARRMAPGGPVWTRAVRIGALLVIATSAASWLGAAFGPLGAPYGLDAVARWTSLFGLACGASVLADAPEPRQRVLEAVTLASAVVAGVGLLQHLELAPLSIPVISRPGSTFGNRNLAAEAMAVALPLGVGAAAGARTRGARVATIVALVLQLVFLAVTRTRGAWVGAACGLGVTLWCVRRYVNRAARYVALGAGVAAVLGAWVPGRLTAHDAGDAKRYSAITDVLEQGADVHSTAVRTRLGLWRRTVEIFWDHPWLGVGPGNWPVVFPLYAEPNASREGVLTAAHVARQAHQDWLERAAETGAVGLIALVALASAAAVAVRRRQASEQRDASIAASAAGGALAAVAGVSLASFPLEMPATIALTGLALGLVAPVEGKSPSRSLHWQRSWVPAALGILLGLGLVAPAAMRVERSVRSSWWLGAAERAMRRDRGSEGTEEALADLDRALAARPADCRALFRDAQALQRDSHWLGAARAARRALAIEPYSPHTWALLASAELDAGDNDAAKRDATNALALLYDYPLALDVRARAAERSGDLPAARDDRRHIDALASGPANDDATRAARSLR